MKECIHCLHKPTCTLFEQKININLCEIIDEIDMDCSTEKNEWYEFSWNRYTESSLDYGEESEWDKYLEEDNLD